MDPLGKKVLSHGFRWLLLLLLYSFYHFSSSRCSYFYYSIHCFFLGCKAETSGSIIFFSSLLVLFIFPYKFLSSWLDYPLCIFVGIIIIFLFAYISYSDLDPLSIPFSSLNMAPPSVVSVLRFWSDCLWILSCILPPHYSVTLVLTPDALLGISHI